VEALAGWLSRRAQPGDRVAALAENPRHHVEGLLACARAGLVWAPISLRLAEDAQVALLGAYEPTVTLAGAVPAGASAGLVVPLHEWEGAEGSPPLRRVDDDEVVCLISTGGTTGRSKEAALTHRSLLADARAMTTLLDLGPPDLAVHTISMWHLGGIWPLLCHLLAGGGNVLLDSADPVQIVRTVERLPVTGWNAVPVMIRRVLDTEGCEALRMLRWVGYGGAAMPATWLNEAVEKWGPVLHHVYGLTEASPVVTCLRPDDLVPERPERLASCGRAIPGVDVRITDDDGPVAPGEVGEIEVRGDVVMAEYWRAPEATEEALRGGWLRTGDLGVLDHDGYLRIVDRRKDVIITGGLNVFSREVEDAISELPSVIEAAVVAYPDEYWGESVAALVVLRPGTTLSEAEVRTHVARRVARHARPRRVRVVEHLPRTPIGKIDKPTIRRLVLEGEDGDSVSPSLD
jgi:fatty-acyl-CoA synthase